MKTLRITSSEFRHGEKVFEVREIDSTIWTRKMLFNYITEILDLSKMDEEGNSILDLREINIKFIPE